MILSRPRRLLAQGSRASGFTMVELGIAVAVFTVALLASMQTNLTARRLATSAAETQSAVRLLESARAVLGAMELGEITGPGGEAEPGAPLGLPLVLEGQLVTYEVPDWVPGTVPSAPLGVRFTVSWTSREGEARSLSSLGAVR